MLIYENPGAFAVRRVGGKAGQIISKPLTGLAESTTYFITCSDELKAKIENMDLSWGKINKQARNFQRIAKMTFYVFS